MTQPYGGPGAQPPQFPPAPAGPPGWWLASDGQWYPPPQPGYAAPAYQPAWGAPTGSTTNGFAIASLVLGILWLYGIGSILALVFGYLAKGQIRESGGTQSGGGMATAGIVLGWVGVALLTLVVIAVAASRS